MWKKDGVMAEGWRNRRGMGGWRRDAGMEEGWGEEGWGDGGGWGMKEGW